MRWIFSEPGVSPGVNIFRLVNVLMAILVPITIYAGASELDMLHGSTSPVYVHASDHGADNYHLATGDTIRIQVFGEDDLNLEVRLDSRGVINYPFLGKIQVASLTVEELRNKLIRGLKDGYLRSPQVNVSIVKHRSFFIEGEVKKPGAYPYQPGLTVRKAISLAGGFTDFSSRENFSLVHDRDRGKLAVTVSSDTLVGPGDSITVAKSVFYVDGEVNNPGSYPYHSGLTLREAISLGGGLTERASDSNIQIVSKDGSEHKPRAGMGTKIISGDSIYVKQSFF